MITTFFGSDALGSNGAFLMALVLGFGFGLALGLAGFGSSRKLYGIFYFHNVASLDKIKSAHGVPAQLASCHTAIVAGYVVEGHVPADAIQRLLRERPRIKGIAVPGMPAGSPGMEGASAQPYDIMSFDAQGRIAYESPLSPEDY